MPVFISIITWLVGPVGRYVVLAVVVAGAFLYARQHWIDVGYDKALHAVAAKDEKAKKEAQRAAKDVSDCYATGGWWDISLGVCSTKPSEP